MNFAPKALIGVIRLLVLIAAIAMATGLGWRAATPPPVLPATAPTTSFSAARAMTDMRAITIRPHPTGSADNVRVATYLSVRMAGMGLKVQTRHYLIDANGIARLKTWSSDTSTASELVDVIGIMPGRDRAAPAIALTAHYDTVWGSPGAGDGGAGVAAALEIARAIRARGVPARDLIVLLADGGEIGAAGARAFWSGDALAARVGAVVNLDARGAGGRATLIETGAGDAAMIALFGRAVAAPVANSLITTMRNALGDASLAPVLARGLPGFTFAFMGRAAYYHSPLATRDRLDPRSMQDIGAQGLNLAVALLAANPLPSRGADATFFDVLGTWFVHYPASDGWLVVAGAAMGLIGACVGLLRAQAFAVRSVAEGMTASIRPVIHAALGLIVFDLASRGGSDVEYLDRLAALPRLEAQAMLVCLAALGGFLLTIGPAGRGRWTGAMPALALAILGLALGGPHGLILTLGVAGIVLGLIAPGRGVALWGGWIGAILMLLLAAIVGQWMCPPAAWLFGWPALLLAVAVALSAWLDPRFDRGIGMTIAGVATVIVAAPLLSFAHLAFLDVGAERPAILLLTVPPLAAAFWPIARTRAWRSMLLAVACALVAAGTIAVQVRMEPAPTSAPGYLKRLGLVVPVQR